MGKAMFRNHFYIDDNTDQHIENIFKNNKIKNFENIIDGLDFFINNLKYTIKTEETNRKTRHKCFFYYELYLSLLDLKDDINNDVDFNINNLKKQTIKNIYKYINKNIELNKIFSTYKVAFSDPIKLGSIKKNIERLNNIILESKKRDNNYIKNLINDKSFLLKYSHITTNALELHIRNKIISKNNFYLTEGQFYLSHFYKDNYLKLEFLNKLFEVEKALFDIGYKHNDYNSVDLHSELIKNEEHKKIKKIKEMINKHSDSILDCICLKKHNTIYNF